MKLSNQAKWYLTGKFPIYTGITGHLNPEPKAMQELIDKGYVREEKDNFTGNKTYNLTEFGTYQRNPNTYTGQFKG